MVDWFWIAFSVVLAFIVGFAIQRGSVCAVIAARQLIVKRRSQRFRAFLLAACWAMVVSVPLAWLFPERVGLSPSYAIGMNVVLAAMIFGIGAYINNACAFGTLTGLTRGNLNYVATIVGIVLGAVLVASLNLDMGDDERVSPSFLAEPSLISGLVLAVCVMLLTRAMQLHYRVSRRWMRPLQELVSARRWRAGPSMAILGITGGLLYSTSGEWTYLSLLSERAAQIVHHEASNLQLKALIASTTLVGGGVMAARLSGRFRWMPPQFVESTRKIIGGALMSGSAAVLPGGNDVLLFYGVSSLAPYALVGYPVMMISLCLMFAVRARI